MPVVLLNRESVVLLHIGWRGLNKGIVLKALELLKPDLAVLGPSARGCCYEIQSDLIEKFGSSAIYREIEGRIYLNLPAMLKESLSGIPLIDSNICTMCDLRYFSHRRKDSGSNITLICAP
jgi:copper oxidase (laccase) domain-containing protein